MAKSAFLAELSMFLADKTCCMMPDFLLSERSHMLDCVLQVWKRTGDIVVEISCPVLRDWILNTAKLGISLIVSWHSSLNSASDNYLGQ